MVSKKKRAKQKKETKYTDIPFKPKREKKIYIYIQQESLLFSSNRSLSLEIDR
jgi:hypothetical protein